MIDRHDNEQKYNSGICAAIACFSMRRRITYRSRSNAASSVPAGAARGFQTMICSISGRVALAFSPMQATLIGTCRQP